MSTKKPSEVFADRVGEVRKHKGITQHELAKRLGLNRAAVTRIEGEARSVSIDDMVDICAVLGVSPLYMIVPIDGTDLIQIGPMTLFPREAREWMRGQRSLRAEDNRIYFSEVSADQLRRQHDVALSKLFLFAQSVLDAVIEAETEGEITDEARRIILNRVTVLNDELTARQKGQS